MEGWEKFFFNHRYLPYFGPADLRNVFQYSNKDRLLKARLTANIKRYNNDYSICEYKKGYL